MKLVLKLLTLSIPLFLATPSSAETRVGLVVAVDEYAHVGKLTQPVSDAEKIYTALLKADFRLPALLKNPSKAQLDQAFRELSRSAQTADVAILYFAGHGIQYENDNWIIPSDAKLQLEPDVLSEATRLQDVLSQLKRARLRIVVLDACRNNPFVIKWGPTRAIGDGLGRVPDQILAMGTIVAFSAAAGTKSPDDGAYASALATHLTTPGLELKQVLDRVAQAVGQRRSSASPEYTARYEGAFSFVRPPAVSATAPATASAVSGLAQAPKRCRLPEHGVESWGYDTTVNQSSNWRGGGGSQPGYCAELQAQVRAQYPEAVEILTRSSTEQTRDNCSPLRCIQYQYQCSVSVRGKPIFKEADSARCP